MPNRHNAGLHAEKRPENGCDPECAYRPGSFLHAWPGVACCDDSGENRTLVGLASAGIIGDGDAYCETNRGDEGHSLLVYHGGDTFAAVDAAFEVIVELSFDLQ